MASLSACHLGLKAYVLLHPDFTFDLEFCLSLCPAYLEHSHLECVYAFDILFPYIMFVKLFTSVNIVNIVNACYNTKA